MTDNTAAPEGTEQTGEQGTEQAVAPDRAIVAALTGKRDAADASHNVSGVPQGDTKDEGKGQEKEGQEAEKENTPESPEPASGGLNDIDLSDVGNPEVQGIVNAFRGEMPQGLDLERVFALAIETGDPDLINTSYLRQAGGENAAYLESLAKRIVSEAATQSGALVETIYAEAGGQANWDAATAVFNKEAPKHLQLAATRFIDSKNYKEIEHGLRIVLDYAKKSGGVVQTGSRHTPTAGASSPKTLDKEGYRKALQELGTNTSKAGWQDSWNELETQRRAGMQLGL